MQQAISALSGVQIFMIKSHCPTLFHRSKCNLTLLDPDADIFADTFLSLEVKFTLIKSSTTESSATGLTRQHLIYV